MVILLVPEGADPALVEGVNSTLQEVVSQAGLELQNKSSLSPGQLGEHIQLVVAFPPIDNLQELVASAPGTKFLVIDTPGITASPNLVTINSIDGQPGQMGFMAGVISAIITEDWRVASITQSNNSTDQIIKQGFLNGVVYFCGLCRPTYPPFYTYPLSVEIPANATSAEKQALVDSLSDSYIKTVFVSPQAADEEMYKALSEADIHIISTGDPAPELKNDWVVSLSYDLSASLKQIVPALLEGKEVTTPPMPLVMTNINPSLFSPGRQALANKILEDLMAGYIDTGVSANSSNGGE